MYSEKNFIREGGLLPFNRDAKRLRCNVICCQMSFYGGNILII